MEIPAWLKHVLRISAYMHHIVSPSHSQDADSARLQLPTQVHMNQNKTNHNTADRSGISIASALAVENSHHEQSSRSLH